MRPARRVGRERRAQLGDRADGPHAPHRSRARGCARPARRTGRAAPGARSATAWRWRATVASSPRATGPVSAALGAERGPVVDACARTSGTSSSRASPGSRPAPAAIRSAAACERDEEVGGHRRGGVVGGAALVVDLERRHPERAARDRRRRRAPRGVEPATAQPAPANAPGRAAGERLERVQPEGLGSRRRRARSAAWRRSCARRSGAAPATAAAAAGISASGTHSTIASQPAAPRRGRAGPRRRRPASRSARASARAEPARADDAHADCALESVADRVQFPCRSTPPWGSGRHPSGYPRRIAVAPQSRRLGPCSHAAQQERREDARRAVYREASGCTRCPLAAGPHAGRVRDRQRRRRPDVRRRGARASTRTSRACRSWAGPASCSTSCWARSGWRARRCSSRSVQVPPAGQPRPAPGGDRRLQALPAARRSS